MRINIDTSALVNTSEKVGVRRRESRAKMRGNTPFLASTLGSSPCRRIQPLSAPSPLIAANTASTLPAPAPQKRVATSTNGALEEASCAGGTSRSTVGQAMGQINAVTAVPTKV